jgi:serine protease
LNIASKKLIHHLSFIIYHLSFIIYHSSFIKPFIGHIIIMKTRYLIFFFSAMLLSLEAQQNDYIKGQFIVQLTAKNKLADLLKAFPMFESTQKTPEQLMPTMPVFRVFFDETLDEKALLAALKKDPSVFWAQFNHLLDDRATPNDTKYAQQWHHNNPGGGGAVADADIDTDDAWNITKGGVNTDGDTIVVAVIDNGTHLTHPDLQQNLWFNRQEIPDNSIDDDKNGYIDDYRGWNTAARNDNVDNGTHGVEVSGVIGAVGNNNRGVAGVNWAVKIMTLVYDGSESSIIGSYGYVMAQRKLYNDTKGKRGAFVVVTNSSFGSPNRFQNDSPIWCAMYDSLGAVGVLSVGATANNNVDVDQVGDLPSTCQSNYLVVVTSSDNKDVKATNAAFGPVNVDVTAPGVAIWTTSPNGDYTAQSGTSLACPIVAGIAALAYAAPCPDFTNFSKSNPSAAALLMKDWILKGVDVKPDLLDKVKTGGRVNAFQTVQKVTQYCGACVQPSQVRLTSTTNSVSASMMFLAAATNVEVRYKMVGAAMWTTLGTQTTPLSITGLQPCTNYEIELKTSCVGSTSTPLTLTFKTDGCCSYPENILIYSILNNQLNIKLSKVTAATGYRVCFKETAAGTCTIDKIVTDTAFIINNLKACQNYGVTIQSVCANNVLSKDTLLTFKTKGCGACYDSIYCRASGTTPTEWIDSFSIATFKNFTGQNGGYAKFDTTVATLLAGKSYPISIKPGFWSSSFSQGARVWIDLNQDGDFDDAGEQIIEFPRFTTTVTGTITIPVTAVKGTTRLRVGMRYVGFSGTPPTSCENFSGGEIEDYCVQLDNRISTDDILRKDDFAVFPNPFNQFLTVRAKDTLHFIQNIEILSLDGRVLVTKKIANKPTDLTLTELDPLSNGLYILKIQTPNGVWVSKIVK